MLSHDRTEKPKIEITPEMSRVGLEALEDHLLEGALTDWSRTLAVRAVYLAMCKAATRETSPPSPS